MNEHDDKLGSLLREALHREAETYRPVGDGLQRIRARTSRQVVRPSWFRPALIATSAAAAAVIGAGSAVTLFRSTDSVTITTASQDVMPIFTSSGQARTDAAEAPRLQARVIPVPVYYLGDTGSGKRLYREFHWMDGSSGRIEPAIRTMLADRPLDPEYRSPWPEGTRLLGVERSADGKVATVNLSREALGASTDPQTAKLATQQLVYTVTAADNMDRSADQAVEKVQLLVEGKPVDTLWGTQVGSEPLTRAARSDVEAPAWIIGPQNGDALTGGTKFIVQVVPNAPNGRLELRVLRDGRTVATESMQIGGASDPGARLWTVPMELPPGRYTLQVLQASEGKPARVADTKSITVTPPAAVTPPPSSPAGTPSGSGTPSSSPSSSPSGSGTPSSSPSSSPSGTPSGSGSPSPSGEPSGPPAQNPAGPSEDGPRGQRWSRR